jgi:type I restriction enzyme S subunit
MLKLLIHVYYYLTQNDIVNHLHAIGEQAVSTYPTIRPSDIEDLSVFLPPLYEQKRISSILYSLDSKISCNSRINDNLEQQAQALFKSWFVDFEPFKDGEFVESEMGRIPKNLLVKRVSEIPHTIETGRRPKGGVGEITSGVPSVGAEHG